MPRKNVEQGETAQQTEDVKLPEDVLAKNEELVEQVKVEEGLKATAPAQSVRMVEKTPYTVKVKFLEAHEMTIALDTFKFKAGDITHVEPHTANRLVARKIAYII